MSGRKLAAFQVFYLAHLSFRLILIGSFICTDHNNGILVCNSVADPGFPVGGGVHPLGGAWTSDAGTFQ